MTLLRDMCVRRSLAGVTFAFLVFELTACGGGGASSSGTGGGGGGAGGGQPTITSVGVSGPSSVYTSACVNFTPTVSGTGNYSQSVQWYVDDEGSGNSETGVIDSNGHYCAPAQPPPAVTLNPMPIKAASVEDPTKSATVNVAILLKPPILTSISPQPATAGDQITIAGQYLGGH